MTMNFNSFDVKNKINSIIGGSSLTKPHVNSNIGNDIVSKIMGKNKSVDTNSKILGKSMLSSLNKTSSVGNSVVHNIMGGTSTKKNISFGGIQNNPIKHILGKDVNRNNIFNKTVSNNTTTKNIYKMGVWDNPEKIATNRIAVQRMIPRSQMFKDKDKDGFLNVMDCQPWNKRKQGPSENAITDQLTGQKKLETYEVAKIEPLEVPSINKENANAYREQQESTGEDYRGNKTKVSGKEPDYIPVDKIQPQETYTKTAMGRFKQVAGKIFNAPAKFVDRVSTPKEQTEEEKLKQKEFNDIRKEARELYAKDLGNLDAYQRSQRLIQEKKRIKLEINDQIKARKNPVGYGIGKLGEGLKGFAQGTSGIASYDQFGRQTQTPASGLFAVNSQRSHTANMMGISGWSSPQSKSGMLGGTQSAGTNVEYTKQMMSLGNTGSSYVKQSESMPFDVKMALYTGNKQKAEMLMAQRRSTFTPAQPEVQQPKQVVQAAPRQIVVQQEQPQVIVRQQPVVVRDPYDSNRTAVVQGQQYSPLSRRYVRYPRGPYRQKNYSAADPNQTSTSLLAPTSYE